MARNNYDPDLINFFNLIDICKELRNTYTNLTITKERLILLESIMNETISYGILDDKYDMSKMGGIHIQLVDFPSTVKHFRKTKSSVLFSNNDNEKLLTLINVEDSTDYVLLNLTTINELRKKTESRLVNFEDSMLFKDIPDRYFTPINDTIIESLEEKKTVDISLSESMNASIHTRLFGRVNKCDFIGYRLVHEEDKVFILQFKQTYSFGNIYTYVAYLKHYK